jgi:hypothetical protein
VGHGEEAIAGTKVRIFPPFGIDIDPAKRAKRPRQTGHGFEGEDVFDHPASVQPYIVDLAGEMNELEVAERSAVSQPIDHV